MQAQVVFPLFGFRSRFQAAPAPAAALPAKVVSPPADPPKPAEIVRFSDVSPSTSVSRISLSNYKK